MEFGRLRQQRLSHWRKDTGKTLFLYWQDSFPGRFTILVGFLPSFESLSLHQASSSSSLILLLSFSRLSLNFREGSPLVPGRQYHCSIQVRPIWVIRNTNMTGLPILGIWNTYMSGVPISVVCHKCKRPLVTYINYVLWTSRCNPTMTEKYLLVLKALSETFFPFWTILICRNNCSICLFLFL